MKIKVLEENKKDKYSIFLIKRSFRTLAVVDYLVCLNYDLRSNTFLTIADNVFDDIITAYSYYNFLSNFKSLQAIEKEINKGN